MGDARGSAPETPFTVAAPQVTLPKRQFSTLIRQSGSSNGICIWSVCQQREAVDLRLGMRELLFGARRFNY
jgi:hypothetical protein